MPTITIGTQVIDFPDTGTSQDWSQPVIDAVQAIADSLSALTNAGDIVPNEYNIDSFNPATNQSIVGLALDTTIVRGAEIRYSVYRNRDTTYQVEYGKIFVVYNANGTSNQKWTVSREYTGDAGISSISMTDAGQVQISTTTIAGSGAHTGKFSYAVQTLLQ